MDSKQIFISYIGYRWWKYTGIIDAPMDLTKICVMLVISMQMVAVGNCRYPHKDWLAIEMNILNIWLRLEIE